MNELDKFIIDETKRMLYSGEHLSNHTVENMFKTGFIVGYTEQNRPGIAHSMVISVEAVKVFMLSVFEALKHWIDNISLLELSKTLGRITATYRRSLTAEKDRNEVDYFVFAKIREFINAATDVMDSSIIKEAGFDKVIYLHEVKRYGV